MAHYTEEGEGNNPFLAEDSLTTKVTTPKKREQAEHEVHKRKTHLVVLPDFVALFSMHGERLSPSAKRGHGRITRLFVPRNDGGTNITRQPLPRKNSLTKLGQAGTVAQAASLQLKMGKEAERWELSVFKVQKSDKKHLEIISIHNKHKTNVLDCQGPLSCGHPPICAIHILERLDFRQAKMGVTRNRSFIQRTFTPQRRAGVHGCSSWWI
jgi:hypothetical protein